MKTIERQPVVLVTDDSDDDLLLFRRAFQQLGHSGPVYYLDSGAQAIAYLAGEGKFGNRTEFPLPDFLLLDLKMPGTNGFDVLAWIQAQQLTRLRTIVLTSSEDRRQIDKAYGMGAASLLNKPMNLSDFKNTLRAFLDYWLGHHKQSVSNAHRAPSPNPCRFQPGSLSEQA
jgi:CheY-like chemotaxis protein